MISVKRDLKDGGAPLNESGEGVPAVIKFEKLGRKFYIQGWGWKWNSW